jgi:type I restriction enzyme, S subunit
MKPPETPHETWQWTRLGDLCRFTNGYPFRPEDWADQGQPIIRIQNLNGGEEFNFWDRPIEDRYQVEPGDLLFAWSGNRGTSFGPYVWRGSRGLVNQHIFKVSPSAGVSKEWLFQALDGVRAEAEKQAHGGSGLVHVRHSDLVEYPVLTPPPVEQARIAEVLDTLDDAIRGTGGILNKLLSAKQGLLRDLLTYGIGDDGHRRDANANSSEFADSSLGKFPKSWAFKKISECCLAVVDCPHSTPQFLDHGVLVARTMHIK